MILVDDEEIQLRDASDLWRKDTFQLTSGLRINLERSSELLALVRQGRKGFALPASSLRQGPLEEEVQVQ
jgi:hypothetical protein